MNDAWKLCQNSDWMIWAAGRSNIAENDKVWRQLSFALARRTKASIDSNQTCWDVMKPWDRKCIEVAEAFEAGTASAEDRSAARQEAISNHLESSPEAFDNLIHFSHRAAIHIAADTTTEYYVALNTALVLKWAWINCLKTSQAVQTNIIREFIKNPW